MLWNKMHVLQIVNIMYNSNIYYLNCYSNWMFKSLLTYVTGGCNHALPKLAGAAHLVSLSVVSGIWLSYFIMKIAFNWKNAKCFQVPVGKATFVLKDLVLKVTKKLMLLRCIWGRQFWIIILKYFRRECIALNELFWCLSRLRQRL